MPIYSLGEHTPQIDPQSWIAPNATVIGQVHLARNVSIWWNCTLRGDTDRLARLLSDSLIYGHADGRMQTKEVFLAAVRTNRIKYEAYDYQETKITRVTDDVAIMTGHAQLRASAGSEHVKFALRFLAVWRREDGVWRLFAYQSSKLDDPVVVSAGK